jgi:hypothetical protein
VGGTSPASFSIQLKGLEEQVAGESKKFSDKQQAFSAMMGA